MDSGADALGAPGSPMAASLHYRRPARTKQSSANLRQQASRASIRTAITTQDNNNESQVGEATIDASVAPTPVAPPATLDSTTSTLTRLMDDASKGKFAVGNLGRVLIEQEEQMRSLIERLSNTDNRQDAGSDEGEVAALIRETEVEIAGMRQEQQKLLSELLQTSNIHVPEYTSTSTHVETFAASFIDSLGATSAAQVNGSLSSPTKPINARELRRQKNAAAPDLGKNETLVNEIQQQLINEVRRLQALIAERDKALAKLNEASEEAERIRALHEATIKRLESEKDAQDANLYELERKEELLREENEEVGKQVKKYENDLRVLKRQLAEKSDAAETFKASNEELEQRVDDLRSNMATMKAKSVADQKTISGLKVQVSDLETKHTQAMEKIPASMSIASRLSSGMHGSSFDATQIADGYSQSRDPNSPSARRSGPHDKAFTPTVSIDDDLTSRLRSSDAVRGMESDIAKWRSAAMKYRKKWNDVRRQSMVEGQPLEHDDSTDDDQENEEIWQDENAGGKGSKKRGAANSSRNVSAGSRRNGKTMGDAFGLINRIVSGGRGHARNGSWQSQDIDASMNDDDGDSSIAASSTRGSIDGFDPNFADPTIRGASTKDARRRSTLVPAQVTKASPLTRQLRLTGDQSGELDDSVQSHDTHAGSIIHPAGALGDELNAFQTEGEESVYLDTGDKEQERLMAALEAEAERHEAVLQSALGERDAAHTLAVQALRDEHANALSLREAALADQVAVLQSEHEKSMVQLKQSHAHTLEAANQRHAHLVQQRGIEHDSHISVLDRQHEEKLNEHASRHGKMHEEAMAEARQRHTEALSRQRDEAQNALLAAQREHKVLSDERDRMNAETMKRVNAQHNRELMHRDKEHQGMLEDVQATHEAFVRQRDAVYSSHISQRDDIIKVKEEELSKLQTRMLDLEREIGSLRDKLRTAEESARKAVDENEQLHADAAKRQTELQANEEALQQAKIERDGIAVASETAAKPERSSQTEQVSTSKDGPTDQVEVVKSDDQPLVSMRVPPVPAMPPPPPLATTLARTRGDSTTPRRPMSPPPAELIARSQQMAGAKASVLHATPAAASTAEVMQNMQRPSSRLASGPPPSAYTPATVGRRSNTPSLLRMRTTSHDGLRREAERVNASSRLQHQQHTARAPSAQSFVSDATSDLMSGRTSQASYYVDGNTTMGASNLGHGFGGRSSVLGGGQMGTDSAVLGSITQAMIGDYLWKYTRRGLGRSNVRHRRYFWVHPYTRTLYWTMQAPSEAVSTEVTNKSAFIQDVIVVEDDNTSPPDLYHLSIVVSTLTRDVKMTARDREQHELWTTALGYLVNRELPTETRQAPSEWRQSITKASMTKLRSRATGSSVNVSRRASVTPMSPSKSTAMAIDNQRDHGVGDSTISVDKTPRARASTGAHQSSLLHRRDTAAKEYFEQWESLKDQALQKVQDATAYDHTTPRATSSMSRRSATTRGGGSLAKDMFGSARHAAMHHANSSRASVSTTDTTRFMSAEQMLAQDAERDGYEGLDNVRACCDGKHDVGALAHRQYAERMNHRRGSVGSTRNVATGSRSTTPGLMQRVTTTRASRGPLRGSEAGLSAATRAASPGSDGPPQLGPLNINVLDNSTITSAQQKAGSGKKAVPSAIAGKSSASNESTDWHSANEFGSFDAPSTSSPAPKTSSSSQHKSANGNGPKSSYIERISQIRRNRASASIR